MTKLSQSKKIIQILKSRPMERMRSRQIAYLLIEQYPDDYVEKRRNARFKTDNDLVMQIAAEIGSQKDNIAKIEPHIHWQDRPKPRVYWFDPNREFMDGTPPLASDMAIDTVIPDEDVSAVVPVVETQIKRSEHDLYPLLMQYLKTEHKLYCQRIDERRSKNTKGCGGNHWLHPDIVAMHPVAREWHSMIQTCIKAGASQSVRLLSYEVKKHLTVGNVRECFFQAVSNSSWANEGYLVATSLSPGVEAELRVLNALHGIGVILLDADNPSESDLILPARANLEVDWQSVNRILLENDDFKDFVDKVSIYYQTGNLRTREWNNL